MTKTEFQSMQLKYNVLVTILLFVMVGLLLFQATKGNAVQVPTGSPTSSSSTVPEVGPDGFSNRPGEDGCISYDGDYSNDTC